MEVLFLVYGKGEKKYLFKNFLRALMFATGLENGIIERIEKENQEKKYNDLLKDKKIIKDEVGEWKN